MGPLNQLMGMAELASEHGEVVDQLLEFVHWFMLILGVGWCIFIGIAIWKFRRAKNPKANHYGVHNHASTHIEVGVIITEAVLLLGFAYPLWSRRVDDFPAGEDVVRVRAVGQQFFWTFHYAGADGKFGRVDPELMTANNAVGLDKEDPNAKDDFTDVNTLTLPIDKKVIVGITPKDVIHCLSIHPLRIAQDANPGSEAHVWFTAQKVGSWDIVCGQLCGSNHGIMRAQLDVIAPDKFEEWMKAKTPVPASAPAPAAAQVASPPIVAGN